MSLPDGWTLERVRAVAQVAAASLLPPETTTVFLETRTAAGSDYERIAASVILSLGGLYLVLPDDEEDDWLMGDADEEGTIVCWGYYGPLEDALRAL